MYHSQVVSENTSWTGSLAAVNSFGFGGANVHVLLRSPWASPQLPPNHSRPVLITSTFRNSASSSNVLASPESNFSLHNDQKITGETAEASYELPRLVVAAGRTEEAVTTLLEGVTKKATPALCGLMDKLSDMPTNSHPARGFAVIDSEKKTLQVRKLIFPAFVEFN